VNAALEMQGVVKSYGRLRALDGLDLCVPQGSIFGLVGSNGAGKTTRAGKPLSGCCAPSGEDTSTCSATARSGRRSMPGGRLVAPGFQVPAARRVEELLRFYARLQGVPSKRFETAIDELLGWVHLQERRRSAVRTLSHGD